MVEGLVPALEARGLHRFYHIGDDETAALRDVTLVLGAGEFVAVMGPSGSGKSTLLACLTALDEPDAGYVAVEGQRLSRRPERDRARARAKAFGILLQSGNLFPHLTVGENIALQLDLGAISDGKQERIEDVLAAVELGERIGSYPAHLSGGEAARAGLALALSTDPVILVADEPTAEIDRETERKILSIFDERREHGKAILIATHSESLAARADRIVRMLDGRLVDG